MRLERERERRALELTNSEDFCRSLGKSSCIGILHTIRVTDPFVQFVADLSHIIIHTDQKAWNIRCHVLAGILVVVIGFQCFFRRLKQNGHRIFTL